MIFLLLLYEDMCLTGIDIWGQCIEGFYQGKELKCKWLFLAQQELSLVHVLDSEHMLHMVLLFYSLLHITAMTTHNRAGSVIIILVRLSFEGPGRTTTMCQECTGKGSLHLNCQLGKR